MHFDCRHSYNFTWKISTEYIKKKKTKGQELANQKTEMSQVEKNKSH